MDFVFYDIYCDLCRQHSLTPSGAAAKIGFHRASVTVWKNTGKAPKQEILVKIADFFGVTTDYLLTGKESAPAQPDRRELSDEELKFALFGGDGEITDAMFQEVKNFAAFVMQREQQKK